MQLFDTHAHLDQPEFDADRAEVIARAREAGVENIIAIGTTAATSAVCVRLAAEFEGVYAAVGMQPNYIAEAQAGRLGSHRRAGGRAGRRGDRRDGPRPPLGLHAVRRAAGLLRPAHLRLSQERGLPFVVHMRDCDDDILAMLREAHARGPLARRDALVHRQPGDGGGVPGDGPLRSASPAW